MAHLLLGIDKIADQQGYLVISSDGAVLSSSGDLENDEKIAGCIYNLAHLASKVQLSNENKQYYKRLTVTFTDFCLMITVSNQRIYAVKRPLNKAE
eukprot:gene11023-12186_t